MQALLALIGTIASGEASHAMARARRAAMVYGLAALFVTLGLVFLLIAAFIALAREIGTLDTSLWFGGGFVVVALVIILIHRVVSKARTRRLARQRQAEIKSIVSTAAITLIPALLASRTGSIAVLGPFAAALGYGVWKENARRTPTDKARED